MSELEALKEKHTKELEILEIEQTVKNKIGIDLDMFANTGYKNDTTIFIDLLKEKNIKQTIAKIIKVYAPTIHSKEIDYNGKITHVSPFELLTQSNVTGGNKVILQYSSSYNIRITLPVNFYSKDVIGSTMRSITDSEYHYFTGRSREKLSRIRVNKDYFKPFTSLGYYGGDTKCIITDLKDLEQYNYMALNGNCKTNSI